MSNEVVVVQFGARNDYEVAAICAQNNLLKELHTDIWLNSQWRRTVKGLSHYTKSIKRYLNRASAEIPDNKVVSYNSIGLSYLLNRLWSQSEAKFVDNSLTHIGHFLSAVSSNLKGYRGIVYALSEANGLFDSLPEAYKIIEIVNCLGLYQEFMAEEAKTWPGWEHETSRHQWNRYAGIERQSWSAADEVVCPSSWVREYLISSGCRAEKITTIPYWCDPKEGIAPRQYDGKRKLRILFVGRVALIKGIQYLAEALKNFKDEIELVVIGENFLSKKMAEALRKRFKFIPHVPFSEVENYYKWADVFILPTLCEGSALVVYEALSYGLPVITTPNCGSIVTHGVEGYLIPPRDSETIAQYIQNLLSDPTQIEKFSRNAISKSLSENLDTYKMRIKNYLSGVLNRQ